MDMNTLPTINPDALGDRVPRRHGKFAPRLAKAFLDKAGWRITGEIPNISQAVLLAVPHTSNMDGVYAIPTLLALDVDIKLLGKKQLFKLPILSHFLRWAGVIAIDRDKKGSVLQANINRFKTGKPLFLGLSPEGTRSYTDEWKTGFYYLALGADVPILPVAMDYNTKEVRFMPLFYPTGDILTDLPKIYAYYDGVMGRHADNMSGPLQRRSKP